MSTVGTEEQAVRRYIKEQEAADRRRRCLIRRIGPIPYLLRNRRIDRA